MSIFEARQSKYVSSTHTAVVKSQSRERSGELVFLILGKLVHFELVSVKVNRVRSSYNLSTRAACSLILIVPRHGQRLVSFGGGRCGYRAYLSSVENCIIPTSIMMVASTCKCVSFFALFIGLCAPSATMTDDHDHDK